MAVIAALAGFQASQAEASEWKSPVVVTAQRDLGSVIGLGLGPDGYAVLLTARAERRTAVLARRGELTGRGVFASVRPEGSVRFGDPVRLTPRSVTDAEFAIAENGEALVAWPAANGADLRVWHRTADEDWSLLQTVAGAADARLEVAPDGGAMLEDVNDEDVLQVWLRAPGGLFGAPSASSLGGPHSGYAPFAIGAGLNGGTILTDGECTPAVGARIVAGSLTEPLDIPGQTCTPGLPDLAASAGRSVAIFDNSAVRVSDAYGDDPFAAPVRINPGTRGGNVAIEISGAGNAVAAWQRYRRHAAGVLAAVSPMGYPFAHRHVIAPGFLNSLDMNAAGDAVAITLNLHRRMRVEAVYRLAGGPWGEVERVSGPRDPNVLAFVQSAIGPDGRVIVVWRQACVDPPGGGPESLLLASDRASDVLWPPESSRVAACVGSDGGQAGD